MVGHNKYKTELASKVKFDSSLVKEVKQDNRVDNGVKYKMVDLKGKAVECKGFDHYRVKVEGSIRATSSVQPGSQWGHVVRLKR